MFKIDNSGVKIKAYLSISILNIELSPLSKTPNIESCASTGLHSYIKAYECPQEDVN